MNHPDQPPKSGDERIPEALRRALEALREEDRRAHGDTGMPRDADALFARTREVMPSEISLQRAIALEACLHEHLQAEAAPPVLDIRVRTACAAQTQEPLVRRVLSFAPWLAASVAAAAVVFVLLPLLSDSKTSTPRLVLRVVHVPLDTTFDGRALFHAVPPPEGGR